MNEKSISGKNENEIAVLSRKCRFLTKLVIVTIVLWLGTMLLQTVVSVRAAREEASTPVNTNSVVEDSLRVRELVVVDANGTPRVRIGAPVPDPIMLGKRSKRGDPVSGVIIYDAEGNERGGYGTDEERHAFLTLDEINRAAVHLGVNDRGEMHLWLSNGRGGFAGMGVLPTGGWVRLDKPGQPATVLPPESNEKAGS